MNILARLQSIAEFDKSKAVKRIIKESTPDFDYYLMLILSTLMATLGLLVGSETIVIGAMLLAPLLAPTMGLALGLSMSEQSLVQRSFWIIVKSASVAIISAVVATFLFALSKGDGGTNAIIMSRTAPSILYFMIAAISGFAVAYASVRPNLSESLPAVAIAVALIPPLAVVGIGVALVAPKIISGALLMFLINVAGIVFSAMIAFSLMDVHHKRFMAERIIEKEEKRLEQEEKELQDIVERDKK
jgi:uncharacterized hydrophobic protein (TIGR00271 family)